MNRTFFLIFSTFLFLAATAFTTTKQNTPSDPAIYKLMEVAFLWDFLKEGYEPNRERDQTWLDVGFRSKYAMAKNYASVEMVEVAFDTEVFLRGPHSGDMDFNSTTSFGYYNPEFIAKLRSTIEMALKNPTFKKVAQLVYHKHLRSMARTYHNAYIYLNKDKKYLAELQAKYLAGMASPKGIEDGSFQETFRGYAESDEWSKDSDVYEAFTAPAFWLRRSIDGTALQIVQMQEMVMTELERGFPNGIMPVD